MRRLDRLVALGVAALLAGGCQPQSTLPGSGIPRGGSTRPNSDWLDGPVAGKDPKPRKEPARDAKPADAKFDAVKEGRGALGGVVEDPEGKPAKGVSVEYALADGSDGPGAPLDVLTDNQGRFQIYGLKPGRGYILTARSRVDGRECAGRVYVPTGHPKSQQQVVALNYDFTFPPANPAAGGGGDAPPKPRPNFPGSPRASAPPDTSIPPPSRSGDSGALAPCR